VLNKYPLWKYLFLGFVVIISLLYAAPNLYGEDPAIQVSATRGAKVELATLDKVQDYLKEAKLSPKSTVLENGQILVRLTSNEDQLLAREVLSKNLGDGFVTALNLAPATPGWLEAIGGKPLNLGLDLRGGVHFLMEVDMDEAVAKAQEQLVEDLRTDLREQKIRFRGIRKDPTSETGVILRFASQDLLDKAIDYLEPINPNYQFVSDTSNKQFNLAVAMTEEKLKATKDDALLQNLSILRNRVNELGVAEPLVQRQGADRIVVELPGIQDTATAKEILGATATLEFHAADVDTDLNDALAGRLPSSSVVYKDRNGTPVVVKKQIILTGNHIVDAQSSMDEYGSAQVNISLDSKGGSKMSRFTKTNIGKPMATLYIEYLPTGKKKANGKSEIEKREEIANAALLFNIVMIIAVMAMIPGATLTLPGIAGIVLTVGMAVDANVLIFERIREEIRAGKSIQKSIHEGYANAFSTIADANITTLITAIILFAVGTGSVKGFAVTLAIGIATSMFTSIFGTRAIVNAIWGGRNDIKKLSI